MELLGKVVRLHSKSQPDRYKLYMVIDGEYDDYAYGKVTLKTVNKWIVENVLSVTVYEKTAMLGESDGV